MGLGKWERELSNTLESVKWMRQKIHYAPRQEREEWERQLGYLLEDVKFLRRRVKENKGDLE